MTARKLFGTDGIRGFPGKEPLTPQTISRIAAAFAAFLQQTGAKNQVLIGKDTRASGRPIEKSLIEGLTAAGVDSHLVGVLPTAAVACLTRQLKMGGGIMISASHNPADENGIKFFTSAGEKLDENQESAVEQLLGKAAPSSAEGKAAVIPDAESSYSEFLLQQTGMPDLSGIRLAIDMANGAACGLAEEIFKSLGAVVFATGNRPDGRNINRECGALNPRQLQKEVKSNNADCGLAFDGDADRLVVIDEKGEVVGGDALILALAKGRLKQKKLPKNTVVVTEYTNTAFDDELSKLGGKVIRVLNGDKHVYGKMKEGSYSLGGEQSGHIIFAGNTTGDGILAALHVAALLKESGRTLSELTKFPKKPQILINVPVREKKEMDKLPLTSAAIASAEKQLRADGRTLIRYSGTQNLLRIMVEGREEEAIRKMAEEIAAAAQKEIGEEK